MAGRAGGVPESPGGLPGDGTEAAFVARFERRARVHSFLAGLVFLLIAALVGFAGYVFFRAASITLSDFNRDPSVVKLDRESIDMLAGSVEAQRGLRDLYSQQFDLGQRDLIDLIPVENELSAIRRRLSLAQLREAAGRPLGTDLDRPDPRSEEELQAAIELLQAQQEDLDRYYASVKKRGSSGRRLSGRCGVSLDMARKDAPRTQSDQISRKADPR